MEADILQRDDDFVCKTVIVIFKVGHLIMNKLWHKICICIHTACVILHLSSVYFMFMFPFALRHKKYKSINTENKLELYKKYRIFALIY